MKRNFYSQADVIDQWEVIYILKYRRPLVILMLNLNGLIESALSFLYELGVDIFSRS